MGLAVGSRANSYCPASIFLTLFGWAKTEASPITRGEASRRLRQGTGSRWSPIRPKSRPRSGGSCPRAARNTVHRRIIGLSEALLGLATLWPFVPVGAHHRSARASSVYWNLYFFFSKCLLSLFALGNQVWWLELLFAIVGRAFRSLIAASYPNARATPGLGHKAASLVFAGLAMAASGCADSPATDGSVPDSSVDVLIEMTLWNNGSKVLGVWANITHIVQDVKRPLSTNHFFLQPKEEWNVTYRALESGHYNVSSAWNVSGEEISAGGIPVTNDDFVQRGGLTFLADDCAPGSRYWFGYTGSYYNSDDSFAPFLPHGLRVTGDMRECPPRQDHTA